ncbi:MAG: hypothetical protein ACYC21_10335, partial [Eubacteriales bacterium]
PLFSSVYGQLTPSISGHYGLAATVIDIRKIKIILKNIIQQGFITYSVAEYEKKFNEGMRQNIWNDDASPHDLIFKAFHIAELYAHLNIENNAKQFLEYKYPKTQAIAIALVRIVRDSNPLNPDQCRRCMLKLIRFTAKLLEYPVETMLGLDLVVSERQLKSGAKQYVLLREVKVDSEPMVQLVFAPDNMFFMTFIQYDINIIKSLIDNHIL